jgi:hypothetical protein
VPGNATILTIWKKRSIFADSAYTLERDLFTKLGEPALPEIAVDLLTVSAFFLYPKACGVVAGIVGWRVMKVNRSTGYAFLACAAWLLIIGGVPIASAIREMRRRSGPPEPERRIQAQK